MYKLSICNKAGLLSEDLMNLAVSEWVKDGVDLQLAQGISKFKIFSAYNNKTKKVSLIF